MHSRSDELRKLAEAATPGPWSWERDGCYGDVVMKGLRFTTSQRNAAYIAAASPDVVLGLLDEIERMRSVCMAQRDVHVAHNRAMISQREAESNTLMDIAASVTQERDEAYEAVQRLAGALELLESNVFEDGAPDEALEIAQAALADPVVKRIVEGG